MPQRPKAKRLPLAITGGIAEGKSTVLGYLRELGIPTISSDEIARTLFGTPPVQEFLAGLTGTEGPVDREKVREVLFDPPKRRAMNRFLHPLVWAEIQNSGAVAVEVPLLVEAVLHPYFEHVWVVTCGAEEQRRRLILRLNDEGLVDQWLATQLPTRVKAIFAGRVIRTNCEHESVRADVFEAVSNDLPRYLH